MEASRTDMAHKKGEAYEFRGREIRLHGRPGQQLLDVVGVATAKLCELGQARHLEHLQALASLWHKNVRARARAFSHIECAR